MWQMLRLKCMGFLRSIIHQNAQRLSSLGEKSELQYMSIMSQNTYFTVVECICYDDGCHLRRFAQNPVRRDVTATSKVIANLEIVIDCSHFKGHTDDWCKRNCIPDSLPLLQNVSIKAIKILLLTIYLSALLSPS